MLMKHRCFEIRGDYGSVLSLDSSFTADSVCDSGARWKEAPRQGDWVSVLAILGSFALATPIFLKLLATGSVHETLQCNWMVMPGVDAVANSPILNKAVTLTVGVLVNNLTAIMLFMVTLCASLIHIFSTGYMHGESRYHLFFAYISLFRRECWALLSPIIS